VSESRLCISTCCTPSSPWSSRCIISIYFEEWEIHVYSCNIC